MAEMLIYFDSTSTSGDLDCYEIGWRARKVENQKNNCFISALNLQISCFVALQNFWFLRVYAADGQN